MKYEIGDLVIDEDQNKGIVCIKWNDGDACAIENDAAHPNPIVTGHWPLRNETDFISQGYCKIFVIKEDGYSATAELSKIDNKLVKDYLQINVDGTWYYFNRLFVTQKIRGKGLATRLMNQVIGWADTEKINILNEINPYGDLNLDQLISFYKKFGFKQHNNTPLMTRRI